LEGEVIRKEAREGGREGGREHVPADRLIIAFKHAVAVTG